MDDKIIKAFKAVERVNFVPENMRYLAFVDDALPIGYGQTISQPYTVSVMLEWLDVRRGDKVLDLGSGSGWTTALLGYLVGPKGRVYGVERIPELLEYGRNNCQKFSIKNAEFFPSGEEFGLPEEAPYNRILVSASAGEIPQGLIDQLKVGGKMVIPVQNDILEITKKPKKELNIKTHPGFVFVPLL